MTETIFKKVDSIVLENFLDYWKNPLINKYLGDEASEQIEGFLILRKGKKPLWISHPFNYQQVKKEYLGKVVVKTYQTRTDFKKVFAKETGTKIGFDSKFVSVLGLRNLKKMLPKKKFVDVSKELLASKEIKTKDEIKIITKAVKETNKVLDLARKWIKTGVSEIEIEKKIRAKFEEDGFGTAFCIVAFGENTSNIHHVSGNKKFSSGPVMIDVGAKYKGYCADITRSFFVGKENKEYAKQRKLVEDALETIEKNLRTGVKAKDLFKEMKHLGARHAYGHGIGLEVHDQPGGLSEKSNWQLKEGMVLAIEPATYKKKFGIRLENDYLITKNGFKKL